MVNSQDSNEPVAWMDPQSGEVCRANWLDPHAPERDVDRFTCALYIAPPQRKPLTDEEIKQAVLDDPMYGAALMHMMRDDVTTAQLRQAISGIARAIERALGIGVE